MPKKTMSKPAGKVTITFRSMDEFVKFIADPKGIPFSCIQVNDRSVTLDEFARQLVSPSRRRGKTRA